MAKRWSLLNVAAREPRLGGHRPRPLGAVELLERREMLAAGVIPLGPQTDFSDQPYVEVELHSDNAGLGPYGSAFGLGLYPFNRFLLDTGTNSILSAKDPTRDMESHGYRTQGEYREIGVAGYTAFDVSAPYRFDFRGTDRVTHTLPQSSTDVRIMSSHDVELGGPVYLGGVAGLVGMPAMVNRVTTLDLSGWTTTSDLFDLPGLEVEFSDTLPPDEGHRYSVAVDNRISFDVADGLPPDSPPDAPLPIWAPVPFLTAVAEHQGQEQSGNFLLDTGAQMTMISPDLAIAAGLDEDGDGTFRSEMLYSLPIGGVGGTIEVPVLLLEKLRMPTEQGVDLAWMATDPDGLGLEVLVLDIAEGIDGVLGVDLLTGGMSFDYLDFTVEGAPYFSQIHFDFRNMLDGSGTVYLDLDPSYDRIAAAVTGRHVFYNNSAFDGQDAAADARDDDAIAPDKQALMPGEPATFANYTNYVRGINGIIVDVANLADPDQLDADDFRFLVGNNNDPGTWSPAPAPQSVSVRTGAGLDGTDRVTLIWDDNAITGEWLQVAMLSTANTGLAGDDVFYFGNAVGEAGNSTLNAIVNVTDEIVARNFPHGPINPAAVDDPYDYNRDWLVNTTDRSIARAHQTGPIDALRLITPPDDEPDLVESATSPGDPFAALTGSVDWLDQLQPASATPRPSADKDRADAVDELLASYGP